MSEALDHRRRVPCGIRLRLRVAKEWNPSPASIPDGSPESLQGESYGSWAYELLAHPTRHGRGSDVRQGPIQQRT